VTLAVVPSGSVRLAALFGGRLHSRAIGHGAPVEHLGVEGGLADASVARAVKDRSGERRELTVACALSAAPAEPNNRQPAPSACRLKVGF